jgi:TolB-like protein
MVVLAVLIFLGAAAWLWSRVERPAIDSVAILPFSNSNADTEYLSDGISESIIDSISQLPNLRVMSWSAVSHYKGPTTDPLKAGHDLGVSAVLTGQIVQRNDHVLIQTELVDLRNGTQLWGEQYDRKSSDLIPLQEDISRQISEKLRLRLSGEDERKLTRIHTADPEAYREYLKGRYFWNKRSEDGLKKAIAYFQQAIDRDPAYAQAYAGLADSYDLLDDWGATPPRESFPKARAAALKALELDDSLAEAHTSLAFVKDNYDWDFIAGEQEFKRAIALDPNYATAHQWYAMHLAALQRFPEAEAEMQRAVEIDPLSVIITMGLAEIDDWERNYDAAAEQYRKTLELDPNFVGAHGNLAGIYENQGKYKQALEEEQKAADLSGQAAFATAESDAFAKFGYPGLERKRLERFLHQRANGQYVPALALAQIYFNLGNKDAGLQWLEKAYDERDSSMVYLNVYRDFDTVRNDPRFREVVKKVGLPSH